ncbi:MAG: hypothetical protein ACREUU_08050 [Gammaproteobacteria bacterium]
MWNNSGAMKGRDGKERHSLADLHFAGKRGLLVYVRNLPKRSDERPSLVFEDPSAGETVFRERVCGRCHSVGTPETGKIDLVGAAHAARTFIELDGRMCNHLPQMRQHAAALRFDFPTFSENEFSSGRRPHVTG